LQTALSNGRSTSASTEAVSTSTLWTPQNAQLIVDGWALRGQFNYHSTGSLTSIIWKNIVQVHDTLYSDTKGARIYRFDTASQNVNLELHNYAMEYKQVATATVIDNGGNNNLYVTRLLFDNYYEYGGNLEFVSDEHIQAHMLNFYPTTPANIKTNFLGEGNTTAYFGLINSTFSHNRTAHWVRSRLNASMYKSNTANSVLYEIKNNYFYNAGDHCATDSVNVYKTDENGEFVLDANDKKIFDHYEYDGVPGNVSTGATDVISFQDTWVLPNKCMTIEFENNTVEYTEEFVTRKPNGNGNGIIYFNANDPSTQTVLFKNNKVILPDIANKAYNIYKGKNCDFSSLLCVNENNEVQSYTSAVAGINDIYAGDDFQGGVAEMFTVQTATDMAFDCALNPITSAPGPITSNLVIFPYANESTHDVKDLFTFRGDKVELVGIYDASGKEITSAKPSELNGCTMVASYKGKTTTCNVTYNIRLATESDMVFLDTANTATEYTFNGKTYTLTANNRVATMENAIKAKKPFVIALPGEHAFAGGNTDRIYNTQRVVVLGPKMGVSPLDENNDLDLSNRAISGTAVPYTVDTTKEALFKGAVTVYGSNVRLSFDGVVFGSNFNFAPSTNAQEVSWGLCTGGALLGMDVKNVFVNNIGTFVTGYGSNSGDKYKKDENGNFTTELNPNYMGASLSTYKPLAFLNVSDSAFVDNGYGMIASSSLYDINLDHVYVTGTNSSILTTHMPSGLVMRRSPMTGGVSVTNCKFENCGTEGGNWIYTNYTEATEQSWGYSPYCNGETFPAGITQRFENNTFINLGKYGCEKKSYALRLAIPNSMPNAKIIFKNNTVLEESLCNYRVIDTCGSGKTGDGYYLSAGNADISGNVFINLEEPIRLGQSGSKKNTFSLDENYFATINDSTETVNIIKAATSVSKSDWYYVDRAMTVKNTEVELVDNGYVSIEAAKFDGLNNATIDASESNLMGDVKAFFKAEEGATVEGVYSDAACTKAVTELTGGTVYVNVVKGDAALATKVALTVCDHEGTTSEDVTVEPTCTTEGSKTVTCSVCGKSWSESVAATNEHKFTELVSKTDATCKAEGSATYKCETCEATEDKTLEIDPTAHKWETEYTVDTPATCGTDGSKSYHCEYCDTVNADSVTAIPATGDHSYTVEQSKTEATCMATGTLVMKCANCDATETTTLEINKDNHTGNNTVVGKEEATCGESGYTGDTVCECGEIIAEGAEIPATEKHDYSVKQSETEATCMATGTLVMKCANCDAIETTTLEINKDNHTGNNTVVGKEDATCGETGYTGDTVCECGEIIAEGAEIPATGQHTPSEEITVVTPATPTTEGIGKKVCTVCGQDAELNIVIPATGPKGPVTIGDQAYESLEAALAAAKDDDVIVLHEDVQTGHLALDPEVTLDLNGNDLTAGYVIGFNTSAIIDTDGEGRVVVDKDKIALDQNNGGYLPVYDGEGYKFITITIQEIAVADDASDDIMYYFSPDLSQANAELLQGAAASGVKLVVRLSWSKAEEYNATQDYVYMDEMVKAVIESYNESADYYGLAFTALFDGTEAGNVEDLKVSAVIVSDAGTEVSSQGLALAE